MTLLPMTILHCSTTKLTGRNRRLVISIILACVLMLLFKIAIAEPSPVVASVLVANHAAVGSFPAVGTARVAYSLSESGLTGPRTDLIDVASGSYVRTEQAGPIGDATGYDGHIPWQRDFSGANTPQLGGDRVQIAVNTAYRLANRWWQPDYGGAVVAYVGRESIDSIAFDHLSVTPPGGKRFDAWFAAGSHLLARIKQDEQFLHVTETYDDNRVENGIVLAHRIVRDPGVGQAAIAISTLTSVELSAAQPMSTYACPTQPLTGASIEGGAASTTVPFRLLNNHVYVAGFVNGKGPYTFIVDTGGHTLLSPQLVAAVGLKSVGEAVTSGAGDGHSSTGFVHFDEIAIGGVRLRDETSFATGVYDKAVEGITVDGMIGFELIRRLVTQIDYGRHTITFSDPARFDLKGLGVAVPFVFYDHLPEVSGSIDGLPARIDIDTGSRGELDILSPFVAAQNLQAQFPRGTSAVTGWGVGGAARDYMIRLPSFMLGTVEMVDVAAGLSEAKGGSFSDPNVEGNVGSALLKRFVVTFDYAHEVMYLNRITPTPPDVGTFDRSGLWINATANGFEVVDVARGSAAAAAGIAVGDLISTINGVKAREDGLSDARRLLRTQPAGTIVRLSVQQGPRRRVVTLKLRDQI